MGRWVEEKGRGRREVWFGLLTGGDGGKHTHFEHERTFLVGEWVGGWVSG